MSADWLADCRRVARNAATASPRSARRIPGVIEQRSRSGDGPGPHRGHLQPGQPGGRLYRHDAGRFPPLRRGDRGTRRSSTRRDIVLGGDHLGPNPGGILPPRRPWAAPRRWSRPMSRPASRKLHLDASMGCRGEPAALDDDGRRRARGAARRGSREPRPTSRRSPPAGLCHRHRSPAAGRRDPCPGRRSKSPRPRRRWPRSQRIATAFAGDRHRPTPSTASSRSSSSPASSSTMRRVAAYEPEQAKSLTAVLDAKPRLVFEAHSTDYQPPRASDGAGRGRLRDPEGRPGAHFRAARGALRPRPDRRRARSGLARALARSGDGAADAGRAGALAGSLSRHRQRAAPSAGTSATATASATTGRTAEAQAAVERLLDGSNPRSSPRPWSANSCRDLSPAVRDRSPTASEGTGPGVDPAGFRRLLSAAVATASVVSTREKEHADESEQKSRLGRVDLDVTALSLGTVAVGNLFRAISEARGRRRLRRGLGLPAFATTTRRRSTVTASRELRDRPRPPLQEARRLRAFLQGRAPAEAAAARGDRVRRLGRRDALRARLRLQLRRNDARLRGFAPAARRSSGWRSASSMTSMSSPAAPSSPRSSARRWTAAGRRSSGFARKGRQGDRRRRERMGGLPRGARRSATSTAFCSPDAIRCLSRSPWTSSCRSARSGTPRS